MQVIERLEGGYEVRDVGFGRVYSWCPEYLWIECDCGERPTLDSFETTCVWCGADYADVVQQEIDARRSEGETAYP